MNAVDIMTKVSPYTETAKGIAWDECHKIYVLLDDHQMDLMRDYGYDPLITSNQMSPRQMAAQVAEWYEQSCGLRFVNAVKSVPGNPNDGFIHVIPQFADEDEEGEDVAGTVSVTVHLSDDLALGAADPSGSYSKSYRFDLDSSGDPLADCETVFAICNSYPEEMHCPDRFQSIVADYRAERNRSLSVGDIVQIGEAAFSVDSFGFSPVTWFGQESPA